MDRVVVDSWIAANLLDTDAWDQVSEQKQTVAVVQAERNLARWYPAAELVVALVSYQAVWELQGNDPTLKYQKHNVKSVSDNGESISYKDGQRDVVAPDVRQILGSTAEELKAEEEAAAEQRQYGGELV
ncbi:hypothetical protein [Paenibacillus koleovorans]|uniref:hypothetical protein n=1 Tax=Paenibacillus koleovorans TaxID=121608 RepID=UPI000FD87C37|nr:hypothetical protein [Paenibacillus koleovorans]